MAYGQKYYNQRVGDGNYTLAQIGCFVTSFSNLLLRFGTELDPAALNDLLKNRGAYLYDSQDKAHDILAWSSITAAFPSVHVEQVGGAGWPPTNNAIVKFIYGVSRTPHFCLVADYQRGIIVDSWDGLVRENPYGTPVAWASYGGVVAQPKAPVVNGDMVVTVQAGWGLERVAEAAGLPNPSSPATWQQITDLNGGGAWQTFNKALKVAQQVIVHSAPVPAPTLAPAAPNVRAIIVQSGWGLMRIAQAAGRADAALPACWQDIATANGGKDWQAFNKALKPGQTVLVPVH